LIGLKRKTLYTAAKLRVSGSMNGFETFFFWLFAFLTVTGAVMVVVLRNPLSCALFLILTFINLAGIYALMQAHFVAIAQVLVYAGAIMVLFIFVIMLLNLGYEKFRFFDRHWSQIPGLLVALLSLLGFVAVFYKTAKGEPLMDASFLPKDFGTLSAVGELMFTKYLVSFELIAILLLAATVGAILLAKKVI
jgi:NADH-quinone oxidoreductase subunit J